MPKHWCWKRYGVNHEFDIRPDEWFEATVLDAATGEDLTISEHVSFTENRRFIRPWPSPQHRDAAVAQGYDPAGQHRLKVAVKSCRQVKIVRA